MSLMGPRNGRTSRPCAAATCTRTSRRSTAPRSNAVQALAGPRRGAGRCPRTVGRVAAFLNVTQGWICRPARAPCATWPVARGRRPTNPSSTTVLGAAHRRGERTVGGPTASSTTRERSGNGCAFEPSGLRRRIWPRPRMDRAESSARRSSRASRTAARASPRWSSACAGSSIRLRDFLRVGLQIEELVDVPDAVVKMYL